MKKAIKKIVSAVASVVLGFSMLTSSQVFAKNGNLGDVIGTDLNGYSKCLAIVPTEDSSSSMQGMASDGEYIYVAKIHLIRDDNKKVIGENKARIYRFDPNLQYQKGNPQVIKNEKTNKEYADFGHAGDMTAIKYDKHTYLLILEKKGGNTLVHLLKVNNNDKRSTNVTYTEVTKHTIKGIEFGSISADFIEGNDNNQSQKTLYFKTGDKIYKGSIDIKSGTLNLDTKDKTKDYSYELKKYIKSIEYGFNNCTEPQGMCHYRSNSENCLFLSYSFDKNGKDKTRNIIIKYPLDLEKYKDIKKYPQLYNKVTKEWERKPIEYYTIDARYTGDAQDLVNKNSPVIQFELEGCALIGTKLIYTTDSQKSGVNYDGIYLSKY
ncbi:hypothetical protein [Ruminococcus sp.]|uniref:hypothetical protein n=1 Tax=Ruminococcus sp. TaxID=41978 RepID=UPI0025DE7856|nr:hypothetical protein [Ruminococcus sp.]MCR4637610.1 hypothetical protein [Ruminococcus sp.]